MKSKDSGLKGYMLPAKMGIEKLLRRGKEITTEELLYKINNPPFSHLLAYQNFDLKERLESLKRWRNLSSRSQLLVGYSN